MHHRQVRLFPPHRRMILSPWRIFLIALPFRHLPKPDWGFFPGVRALLTVSFRTARALLPSRAQLRYMLLTTFTRLRRQRHE